MSEWIAFFLFVLLTAGVIVGEIMWLTKKGWATTGSSTAYVILTDFLALGIGGIIVFAAVGVMFMMTMGPAGRGSDAGNGSFAAAILVGLIVPLVVFFLIKRLFMLIFRMPRGWPAWMYSAVVTVIVVVVLLVPPPLVFYILTSVWK